MNHLFGLASMVLVSSVCAIGPASAHAPPAEPPPAPSPPNPSPPKKSLDELLGIGGRKPEPEREQVKPPQGDPALERARERVRRALDEEELEGLLQEIVSGMRSSAQRLGDGGDPDEAVGANTQRVQQDVVDKLDILIDQAQRRRQQSRSSSSRSQQSSPSEREQSSTPGESSSQAGERSTGPDGQAIDPPPPEDPTDIDRTLDESRSEWGHLPARVRDMIRQGRRDAMASIYQRLTEEYYRRMAEDASR